MTSNRHAGEVRDKWVCANQLRELGREIVGERKNQGREGSAAADAEVHHDPASAVTRSTNG